MFRDVGRQDIYRCKRCSSCRKLAVRDGGGSRRELYVGFGDEV